MKKLITLLASASLSVIALSTVIACTDTPTTEIDKENEGNETNPPETSKLVDLTTFNLQTNLNFSSSVDINEQIIKNKLIMINQNLELKWEYLTIINNQGFWLVSLNEEIYINQIKLDISQKTNLNTFDPNITLKTVDDINLHKIEVEWMIKEQYLKLSEVNLIIEQIDEIHWTVTISEAEILYYGSCTLEFYE